MQFKTKRGLVDIPNEDVLAASRDIMSSAQAAVENRGAPKLVGTGESVGRLGAIAAAAPFRDSEWNRTLQDAVMDMQSSARRIAELDRGIDSAMTLATRYRTALLSILDAVDYTAGNCRTNEMVSAVLDRVLITNARAALSSPNGDSETRRSISDRTT